MAAEPLPRVVRPRAHPSADAPLAPAAGSAAIPPPTKRARAVLFLRAASFVVVGGVVGYGYHRIVGCRTGACPISANPYVSTLYGALMGFLLSNAR